jgi:hypothetical protein
MFTSARAKVGVGAVLLALAIVPAPLLPPLGLAGKVQSVLGIGWKPAYLASAIGLHTALYGSLGVLAVFAAGPGNKRRQRWLQLLVMPLVVVGIAVLVRSLKLGHVPMLANAMVPMAACALGVSLGLLFRQHGWRVTVIAMLIMLAGTLWAYWPGGSSELGRATEAQLRRLVDASPKLPAGDERFGVLFQVAFAPMPSTAVRPSTVEHNRAAIPALGVGEIEARLDRCAALSTR